MNLRQKKKHYYHSYNHYLAWRNQAYPEHYPSVTKKQKKTLRKKFKVRTEYNFDICCLKYFYQEGYSGKLPKFMREERRKK